MLLSRFNAMARVPLAISLLVLPCTAQQPQLRPDEIPDEIAYTALFYVIRDAPPPHWDRDASRRWLAQRGFSYGQAEIMIDVATAFSAQHRKLEAGILAMFKEYPGGIMSQAAQSRQKQMQAEIGAFIRAHAAEVRKRLGPSGSPRLDEVVLEIKRDVRKQRH